MAKTEESKDLWDDMPKRTILAHMEYFKAVSEALTKALDCHIGEHNGSEEENGWLDDFSTSVSKAGKELFTSLASAPQKAVDKYFEEEAKEKPKGRVASKA